MKVLVLWENKAEQALANNLVAVLRKIGAMLVYGKVNDGGVLIEDWKFKPKVTLECLATESPSVAYSTPESAFDEFSYEMEYRDGSGYGQPVFRALEPNPGTLSVTRELMRDLVRMFPGEADIAKSIDKTKKRKPVVPKPNTTPTGVTVRKLDLWEDDDHADNTDQ